MDAAGPINHFSHNHPLARHELKDGDGSEFKCYACGKGCTGTCYGCRKCSFFLHRACAELPETREHNLHRHPLRLSKTATYELYLCNYCNKKIDGFTYRCDPCDFDLDIGCAEKIISKEHFGHQEHPLTLVEVDDDNEINWCRACDKRCSGHAYTCRKCNYFLHESCATLEPIINKHPLHKKHPLKLQVTVDEYVGYVGCDSCGNIVNGFVYHCKECKFDLDVECALRHWGSPSSEKQLLEYFGHQHPLEELNIEEGGKPRCIACGDSCLGKTYGCTQCDVYLHVLCYDLQPEMVLDEFHEHPLKLLDGAFGGCEKCHQKITGFTYCCTQCYLCLHTKCALELQENPQSGEASQRTDRSSARKRISYFAHEQHDLFIISLKQEDDKSFCKVCGKRCAELVYGCSECKFYLHPSCTELPLQFQHFFHPHLLKLQSNNVAAAKCGACNKKCSGFPYSCQECNFQMDVECTLMARRKRHPGYIERVWHGHPLKCTEDEPNVLKNRSCSICNKECLGKLYCCTKCLLWLHKSCTDELEDEIRHFFHEHPLKVNSHPVHGKVKCKACRNECQGLTYSCKPCEFHLDIDCARLPSKEGGICFFGHGHPLQPLDRKNSSKCTICDSSCDEPTYVCRKCDFFFAHQRCIKLEKTKNANSDQHSPKHSLELNIKDLFTCAACLKESVRFNYICSNCNFFSLHIACAERKPNIRYADHSEHKLVFFDRMFGKNSLHCNRCKLEIKLSGSGEREDVFRCVRCSNYNLHLLCGPLPRKLKTDRHYHELTLEEIVDDGFDQYYCDVCEEKRDPKMCVYECKNCPYVAAFDCMKSEVTRLLNGKNHVLLRSLEQSTEGEVLTEEMIVTDLAAQKAEEEKEADGVEKKPSSEAQIANLSLEEDILYAFVSDPHMNLSRTITKEDLGISSHDKFLDSQDVKKSMNKLLSSIRETEFSMIFFENEEIVHVENSKYMIFRSLVPVLEAILSKHGDIGEPSRLSLYSKCFVYMMLCGAINNMQQTKDVSETLLINWWSHLMLAKHAGFNIQFAQDHLKRITRAFFNLLAKQELERNVEELKNKITECDDAVNKEEGKIKALAEMAEKLITSTESVPSKEASDETNKEPAEKEAVGKGLV